MDGMVRIMVMRSTNICLLPWLGGQGLIECKRFCAVESMWKICNCLFPSSTFVSNLVSISKTSSSCISVAASSTSILGASTSSLFISRTSSSSILQCW
ncbi:hypothetical protein Hanom_Chr01g00092591 [Helianthus anomalus]